MRVALLLVFSLACLLSKGYADNTNQVNEGDKGRTEVVSLENRVRRNAQPIGKKKKKSGKLKKNKRKGQTKKKISNGKKNYKKSKNRKIKKNRKSKKKKWTKKKKSGKLKKNKRKGQKKKKTSNGKKNYKKSTNRKIKKNRKSKKKKWTKKAKDKKKKQKRKTRGKTKKWRRKAKGEKKNQKRKSKLNRKNNQHGKKKNKEQKRKTKPSVRAVECDNVTIVADKSTRITQMENRRKQSIRAPKFHNIIENKCNKASIYTTGAKRFKDAVNRAGGKANCKTDPTETLSNLTKCQAEVCAVCSSPLNSTWQASYPNCENTTKQIKTQLFAAVTCEEIAAANAKAKKKNKECEGPLKETTDVKLACAKQNKKCKILMETARDIEVDCKAVVDLNDTSTADETQDNRTAIVEASLDTFINGTGDLLNNLGLSSGEGSDGKLSAEALAQVDNITRSDTISDNPTCEGLISYSANLIDFSDAAETQDSLSEEQTAGAADKLGTINKLVSTGAAGKALSGCNTRQSRYYSAIFRWIIWRCYWFFYNWLRRVRCRRLAKLCVWYGEPWCAKYCRKCRLPRLVGGIWWFLPIFTYHWYPVDPCLKRTICAFNCPQCPTGTTTGDMTTATGRRAKFFDALMKKTKT